MWWILWAVVALVAAAVMFDQSPEIQSAGEKVFGIKPASLSTSGAGAPKGVITTKMGMKYVMTSDDVFVNEAGERQSPAITLTCHYGVPYMMLDPKTAVDSVEDARGAKVSGLRVSLDNRPAVTAVADIDDTGKLYIRGAKSAAKVLAEARVATFYVDTVGGLQSVNFEIESAKPALGLLSAGCQQNGAAAAPK